MLTDEEIPEGGCVALALWGTTSYHCNSMLVKDEESFAHRLAKEGGKSIAAQVLDGVELYDIPLENFFSDEYAKVYDEKYKFETK